MNESLGKTEPLGCHGHAGVAMRLSESALPTFDASRMTRTDKEPIMSSHFVEDGYLRAHVALEPVIRAEVEAEFEEELEQASFFERLRIRRKMKIEIERRIHEVAPPDALY